MTEFAIAGRKVGRDQPPYLIAEMSGNHNGSLERALEIVDAAAASGADAVKLQTYTADTMTLDLTAPDFVIDNPDSLWDGRQLYDLYREAHTPWDWHKPIFERARERGIACFSSPFDFTAVDFLEGLEAPAFKIASFEVVDLPLIRKVAATGKPMVISTGLASLAEIDEAVTAAKEAGAQNIVLLKCTSAYPADPCSANLATIDHLRKSFGVEVGLSDHTMGSGVAVASVALGGCVIEKHFTLRRSDGGVDSAFSLEPEEFARMRSDVDDAWKAIGSVTYGGTAAETESHQYRRSLYISKDMQAGDRLDRQNLRAVRPGSGLPPKYLDALLGRRVARPLSAGTPASWDIFDRDAD